MLRRFLIPSCCCISGSLLPPGTLRCGVGCVRIEVVDAYDECQCTMTESVLTCVVWNMRAGKRSGCQQVRRPIISAAHACRRTARCWRPCSAVGPMGVCGFGTCARAAACSAPARRRTCASACWLGAAVCFALLLACPGLRVVPPLHILRVWVSECLTCAQ